MSTRVERLRSHPAADGDMYSTRVVETDEDRITDGRIVAARAVWLIDGILMVLLGFRFLLSLLGANPANAFANFIYSVSHPFVAPFFNLFRYNSYQYGVSRFEVYTLVAMVVYSLIAWGIVSLITIGSRTRTIDQ